MYSASASIRTGSPSSSSTAAHVPRCPAFFQRRGRSLLVRRENRNGLPSLSNASSDMRHSSGQRLPGDQDMWVRDTHEGPLRRVARADRCLYWVMHLRGGSVTKISVDF